MHSEAHPLSISNIPVDIFKSPDSTMIPVTLMSTTGFILVSYFLYLKPLSPMVRNLDLIICKVLAYLFNQSMQIKSFQNC